MLTGLLAAAPVIASAVRAVHWRWFPLYDDGVIATRAYDVLTERSPLVGQFSQASHLIDHPVYSPGPLLYWLLAVPAHIGGTALVLAIGSINLVAVVWSLALARRRGGTVLMFATAIAVALMCRSLEGVILHDIWNPYAAVLPLLLLVFLCWSVASGEHRLLPAAVVVGSFIAQAQLAYVFPAAALLAVALTGLGAARERLPSESSGQPGRRAAQAAARRSALLALIAALVCWSAPLFDQAFHRPGNLASIVQAGSEDQATLGAQFAWHAVARTVGLPPWWVRSPRGGAERLADITAVSTFQGFTALLVLAALTGIALAGVRWRRYELAAAGLCGLALCAAIAMVAGTTPADRRLSLTIGYTLWWTSPAGMAVHILLGWAVANVIARRRRDATVGRRPRRNADGYRPAPRLTRGRAPVAAALATVAGAATLTATSHRPEPTKPLFGPARDLNARLVRQLGVASNVRIEASGTERAFALQAALVYGLRREGRTALPGPFFAEGLGSGYRDRRTYDHVVRIHDGEPLKAGETLVARLWVEDTGRARVPITVGLSPGPRPPARAASKDLALARS